MEKVITYFETPGPTNTADVFGVVDTALAETGIKKIVLASTVGATAEYAMDHYRNKGVRLIIVPHQYGFSASGQRFPQELIDRARAEGHEVYFGTMLFHTDKLFGVGTPQWVAEFLRMFCQGVKVCVEILLMACNGGLVEIGEQVIVVAGSGRGADTALLMTGGTSMDPQKAHISQILCKPL